LKKKIVLVTAILSTVLLTGCASTYKLTEKETDQIAEYVAGLLLQHDTKYDQALLEPEPEVEEQAPEQAEEEKQETQETDNKQEVAAGNTVPENSTDGNQQANADFTEVIGVNGISVEYVTYSLQESYSSEYYLLEPNKGEQLLVLEFEIKNSYKTEKKLSLGSANIQYQLDVNPGGFIKPLFTFFDTDLRYLEMTVPAKSKKTGILIFSVPKDAKDKGMNLIISKESQTAIIKIKE